MEEIMCVGIGGFIGAVMRYLVSKEVARLISSNFPLGTLIVNVVGGFLIGMIMELSVATDFISPNMRLFLTTGIMGGLTTFSTFSLETINLVGEGKYFSGILNIVLNVFLSLGGVVVARLLCRMAL